MSANRAFPKDRAEDAHARRRFPAVWALLMPYWRTRDGMISLLMLAVVIASSWTHTYVMLWSNNWTGTFYDAIGGSHFQLLPPLLGQFLVVAMISAVIQISGVVLHEIVQIRWRRWLTTWLVERWLERHCYYRIERDRALENVDQRIAEDAKLFVNDTLSLVMGFLSVPVSVVSFSIVLWRLGGALHFTFNGSAYMMQGYLVFAAFAYTAVIFTATHYLGRRLITLTAKQHRVEGDFRVMMVRVREFAEQIAFFDGRQPERHRLGNAFRFVVANLYETLWVNTRLMMFTNVVGQVSSVIPTLLVLPQLMSGSLTLGGLMKSNGAFSSVTGSLAFFPQVYPTFTSWRAEANRLREYLYVDELQIESGITVRANERGEISVRGLRLQDAQGKPLARVPDFTIEAGQRWIVRGPSGCGKSTLLRVLAGLWPYGEGSVTRPAWPAFFVPQRSYLPPGSLKAAMTYPNDPSGYLDSECEAVLRDCGLEPYAQSLHEEDRWGSRLSGGEQQRVAFARVLLARPSTIVLDECTSALDTNSERALYRLLLERMPYATIISVAHRKELLEFHDHVLNFPERAPVAGSPSVRLAYRAEGERI